MSTETTPPKSLGSEGQTYLVGETLYLRRFTLGDAKRASAWHESPFPISAVQAEETIKEREGQPYHRASILRLLACRRDDDEPVGLVVQRQRPWQSDGAQLTLHVDPVFGTRSAAIKVEMLRIVVPWLRQDVHRFIFWLTIDSGEDPLRAVAAELDFTEVGRLREAVWRDGARFDQIFLEAIAPVLIQRLGPVVASPDEAARRAPVASGPRPRPVWPARPPRNAILVGQRVYLRPVELDEADLFAHWSHRETETFFDERIPMSRPQVERWIKEDAGADTPGEITFGIALRENDELIGTVGLEGIDWVSRTGETGSGIFRPDYRGKGYGTEAKELLLWYVFARLGFHAVRSFVWSPNTRSAAALRKQGYRPAGRLHFTGSQPSDDLIFDLLATEWAEEE